MAEKKRVYKPSRRKASNPNGYPQSLPNMEVKLMEEDDSKREFIGKAVTNVMVFHEMGKEPITDLEDMCNRLNVFFKMCADTQQIPSMEKLILALGVPRRTLNDWMNQKSPGLGPGTSEVLLRAKDLLAAVDAELVMEGKVNPVTYIFRAKNFYGMKDKIDYSVETDGQLQATESTESIANKYKDIPFEDAEFDEL